MSRAFADSAYFLAVISDHDQWHRRALGSADRYEGLLTTAWDFTEVADALCRRGRRAKATRFLRGLRNRPDVEIVPPTAKLLDAGFDLYCRRPDKDWSLTDCISFVVMERYGLTDALTTDRDFEQAGFVALLK